jgi:hypothetical protein
VCRRWRPREGGGFRLTTVSCSLEVPPCDVVLLGGGCAGASVSPLCSSGQGIAGAGREPDVPGVLRGGACSQGNGSGAAMVGALLLWWVRRLVTVAVVCHVGAASAADVLALAPSDGGDFAGLESTVAGLRGPREVMRACCTAWPMSSGS